MRSVLQRAKRLNRSLGLVPTMGALHKGHLSLVKKAVSENDLVVVSIFVNPTQFDNKADFENYPENLNHDLDLLQTVSNEIIVFSPSMSEMYSGEVKSKKFNFDGLEKVMEGEFRTGHFDGVATVVGLLFNAVKPQRAYFGEKDFQQLQIIKKMVREHKRPIEIIACPIEREDNGLAMSSRNERLSKKTREKAGFIFETLKTAKNKFGTESAKSIKEWAGEHFAKNSPFKLEYFEIADVETLTPVLKKQKNQDYRVFIAVYADGVRLIDNIALN